MGAIQNETVPPVLPVYCGVDGDIDAGFLSKRERLPLELDTRIDLAHVCGGDNNLLIHSNSGSAQILFDEQHVALTIDPTEMLYSRQVQVLDLNQDGFPDVLTANRGIEGVDGAEGFTVLLNLK